MLGLQNFSPLLAILSLFLASRISADQIDFTPCPATTAGLVSNVDITPCERDSGDEPCRFRFGNDYVISLEYTPLVSADQPRTSLEARDDSVDPSKRYPYSGQSFDACEYTTCPVQGGVSSMYTYTFHTLQSRFDHLTINATTSLEGPSFLCVGFDALFLPSVTGRKLA
ncbi:MAG: hypothetical protein CYPHOPRED_003818 [Cyphobasidiales sp. Tagirdzhanova-0007]|nr:MAG: hypothetical protein CYPHOPRED_003818 [Cyphobasidiales sp. Tagirdzhanova-0007]